MEKSKLFRTEKSVFWDFYVFSLQENVLNDNNTSQPFFFAVVPQQ